MAIKQPHGLWRLQLCDIERSSKVLTQSFFEYPDFAYIFPDVVERNRSLPLVMKFLIKLGILRGEVLADSENLDGISIWYKSDETTFSNIDMIRSGIFSVFFRLNRSSFFRFKELGDSKQTFRNKFFQGDYYLLDLIGVDPALRKQGHGKMMIEKKLKTIDDERMPCYLETSIGKNTEYYQRYGFHTIHEKKFHGITSFLMERKGAL